MSNGGGLWLLPREAGEAGRGRLSRGGDHLHDRVDLGEHVMVPEAQDAVPRFLEPSSARSILVLGLDVLTAVELDDEVGLGACEVRDEWADGMLAAEA